MAEEHGGWREEDTPNNLLARARLKKGRMLPLLHSTAMPGKAILSPSVGEQHGTRRGMRNQSYRITIMHTMALYVEALMFCAIGQAWGILSVFGNLEDPVQAFSTWDE